MIPECSRATRRRLWGEACERVSDAPIGVGSYAGVKRRFVVKAHPRRIDSLPQNHPDHLDLRSSSESGLDVERGDHVIRHPHVDHPSDLWSPGTTRDFDEIGRAHV